MMAVYSNEGHSQGQLEVEWTVGPIPIDDNCRWNPVRGCHWGKEIISRYRFGYHSDHKCMLMIMNGS